MVQATTGCTAVAFCTFPNCRCTGVAMARPSHQARAGAMMYIDSHLCRAERIQLGIPRRVWVPSAVFSASRDRMCAVNAQNQAAWWRKNFHEFGDGHGLNWARDELSRAKSYREWAEEGGFKLP